MPSFFRENPRRAQIRAGLALVVLLAGSTVTAQTAQPRQLIAEAQRSFDHYAFDSAWASLQRAEAALAMDPSAQRDLYVLQFLTAYRRRDNAGLTNAYTRLGTAPPPATDGERADAHLIDGYVALLQGGVPEALTSFQAAATAYDALPRPRPSNAGRAYNNIVYLYLEHLGNYPAALAMSRLAQARLLECLDENNPWLAHPYHNAAMALEKLHQLAEAHQSFERALTIRRRALPPNHPETLITLASYASTLNALAQHDRAEQLCHQALPGALAGGNIRLISTIYGNLAVTCHGRQEYAEALRHQYQCLALERTLADSVRMAGSLISIGVNHLALLAFDSAYMAFTAARAMLPTGHADYALALNYIGFLEYLRKNYDEATKWCRLAGKSALQTNGMKNPVFVAATYNLANIAVARGQYQEATNLYNDLQPWMDYTPGDTSLAAVPDVLWLSEWLAGKCRLRWAIYQRDSTLAHLEAVREAANEAIAVYEGYARQMRDASGQQLLKAALYPVLEIALAANHRLARRTGDARYDRASFDLAERAKAFRLHAALQQELVLHTAISDEQRDVEYQLREQIDEVQSRWQNGNNRGWLTPAQSAALLDTLAGLRQSRERFWRDLEKQFGYAPAETALQTISLDSLQRRLRPEQTLLEYFIGDSTVFVFRVRRDSYSVFEQKRGALDQHVAAFSEAMQAGRTETTPAAATKMRYTRAARALYEALVGPFLDSSDHELLIVPDGRLYAVPFEALLTEPVREPYPKFGQYPYLLHRARISYAHSATVWQAMIRGSGRSPEMRGVLGVAPLFAEADRTFSQAATGRGNDHSFAALPFSGPELDSIARWWPGGRYFRNEQATARQFADLAGRYSIVHLSTHGVADAENANNSYIALAGAPGYYEPFYTHNLATLRLSAHLVTLSACESALGKYQRGEGAFSMARACAQAGAHSVATTLWNVWDRASCDIMARFYRYLAQGLPKHEALRRAKLDGLARRVRSEADHGPYYWAGFVLIGDTRAIGR